MNNQLKNISKISILVKEVSEAILSVMKVIGLIIAAVFLIYLWVTSGDSQAILAFNKLMSML